MKGYNNGYKNDKKEECPHKNKSLVVVNSVVTCETVHTICNDCKKVLKIETNC